ncbi:hypothetical protein FA95DRAFT_950006 [Auriscalpium vulgare]|uniref:Uncharacterized protein n=1 Tax=Auriscalpium vulgare TaxID=40419 RepID=A0ACB8RZ57_9AGAM|nr:hypothetical protein FA95DRAFT_950006 [Auriscalpium vulgare]
MRDARNGSRNHLTAMMLAIPALGSLHTVEVVALFCSFLDASKIPSNLGFSRTTDNPDKLAVNCAFVSFQGLAAICDIAQPANSVALLAPIAKAWPMIYPWLIVFYTVYNETFKNDLESRSDQIAVIGNSIFRLTREPSIRLVAADTPGVFKFVAKLWKEEPSGPPPSRTHMHAGTAALQQLLLGVKSRTPLDEVVEAIGSPKAVVQIGLSRLQNALKEKRLAVDRISYYVNVLNTLARGSGHPLRHAILHEGGMAVVTKTLLKLSSTDHGFSDIIPALSACFMFLHNLVEAEEGIPWVKQMIDEGFFQAYVNTSPLFAKFNSNLQRITFSLVGDIIPRYLVFRTIVSVASPALDQLDAADVHAKIARSPARYQDAWDTMQRLAKDRFTLRELADFMRKELGCCDYCRKPSSKTSLRRCSGCRTTLYCSQECQVRGWKKGHKMECKLKQEEKKTSPATFFYRDDHGFHNQLAMTDARLNARASARWLRVTSPTYPTPSLACTSTIPSSHLFRAPPARPRLDLRNAPVGERRARGAHRGGPGEGDRQRGADDVNRITSWVGRVVDDRGDTDARHGVGRTRGERGAPPEVIVPKRNGI